MARRSWWQSARTSSCGFSSSFSKESELVWDGVGEGGGGGGGSFLGDGVVCIVLFFVFFVCLFVCRCCLVVFFFSFTSVDKDLNCV